MKTNRTLFLLSLAAAASMTSCAVTEPRVAVTESVAVVSSRGSFGQYDLLPRSYSGDAYYYGGRHYYGGRYEKGSFQHQGVSHDNRYSHEGRYLYGGRIESYEGLGPAREAARSKG